MASLVKTTWERATRHSRRARFRRVLRKRSVAAADRAARGAEPELPEQASDPVSLPDTPRYLTPSRSLARSSKLELRLAAAAAPRRRPASERQGPATQDAQGCGRRATAVEFVGRFRALGVCTRWMMSASSIGAGKGGGYARYLEGKTVAPERGDYYLTPGGELAEAPGSWLSAPNTLARLGVDPAAPV